MDNEGDKEQPFHPERFNSESLALNLSEEIKSPPKLWALFPL